MSYTEPYTPYSVQKCTSSSIRIYMGGLILGVNTLYRFVCFFKLFIIGGKGLRDTQIETRSLAGKKCYSLRLCPGKKLFERTVQRLEGRIITCCCCCLEALYDTYSLPIDLQVKVMSLCCVYTHIMSCALTHARYSQTLRSQ